MRTLLKNAVINGIKQNLLIENEYISYIGTNTFDNEQEIDLEGKIIISGAIDPHTHIRDLGQSNKEDWTSASNAAIRGGTTMVFDMPNNKPPTINLHNLNLKRLKARHSKVNYKFNIAATSYNLRDVTEILKTNPDDVVALKLFLAGSNSNEYVDNEEVIKRIFDISLRYDLPVIVHTELQKCVKNYADKTKNPTIFDHNYIRNPECAVKGTELVAKLAKEIGNKLYIAHTSVAEEIDIIESYKGEAQIYCEITPHHLLLTEEVLKKVGNFGKVNPPLRTTKDNQRLWQGIYDGIVDVVGTDHAPHRLDEKQKKYADAPSGFPGLETNLPLLLNEVNKSKLDMQRLVELISSRTAEIFNLKKRGKIVEGYYADLVVIDMNKVWKIEPEKFKTKAKYSPFEGMQGKGDVVMTFVNGKLENIK